MADPNDIGERAQAHHERLGNILVTSGVCSSKDIDSALGRQKELAGRSHYKHIGTILLEMGAITVAQLDRALDWQKLTEREV